jgi:outer membrane receptor protein involved in Fe transport
MNRLSSVRTVVYLSKILLFCHSTYSISAIAQSPASIIKNDATYESIIVTGSRLKQPNLQTSTPIITVSAEEIFHTGNISLGDGLNGLPSLRDTWNQQNSVRSIGTAGLNLMDLRGLGISRTLVLVNGHRQVSATEGAFKVDINTIPSELVERIDVVTGGTSAVYGSDAIAGVVNFVLNRQFNHVRVRLQSGISSRGDLGREFLSVTAGHNFAEGRGNITLAAEYANTDPLYLVQRPEQSGAFDGRTQFQLTDDPSGEPNGTDGIPDRTLLSGIRSIATSLGGTYIPYSGTNTLACINSLGCRANGLPRVFRFQPDGSLTEANYGAQDFRPLGSSNQQGGDGNTGRQYGQLSPGLQRYSTNLLGHFDFNEAYKLYFEAKYVRVDYVQESLPSFQAGGANTGTAAAIASFATNSAGIPIAFDNAYLPATASTLIKSLQPTGSSGFRLQRTNLDLGALGEHGRRETYRLLVGLEGDFNEDWHYDVSANYGYFRQAILSDNNRIQQRFRLAVDAVKVGNTILCRSQVPGQITPMPINPADAAALVQDIANCVPINVFGYGAPSANAVQYVNAVTQYTGSQKQFILSGFVTGDMSQLFVLPGGPVGFVLGGEYRRENGSYSYGNLVSNARTFLTAIADFVPPTTFEVKEAFAELSIPIIKDRPLFDDFSLNGALRVANYKGSTGTVVAWNIGGIYAPVSDVQLRMNYAVSVRAPDQTDLYAPQSQNFNILKDPCDALNINTGTATRIANCATAGIPVGFINSPARASSVSYLQGGNPLLKEEASDSLTIGAVLTPRFLPGVSLSVDYYDIKVTSVISSPTAQQILDNCFDAPTLNNAFCTVINRDPATHFFRVPDALIQGGINYAARKARGVDFEADYKHDVGTLGSIGLSLIGNYNILRSDYPFVTDPSRPDQLLFEVGDPELQISLGLYLKNGPLMLGYKLRYVSEQAVSSVGSNPAGGGVEDILSVGGRPAQNEDFSDIKYIPSVAYHDFRFSFDVNHKFRLYGGIDNAFDKLPPQGILGNGSYYAADAVFDNSGRYLYVGIEVNF